MIGIQLQGGLGNQLFQYVAARGLAERLSEALVLFAPHLGRRRDVLRLMGREKSGLEDLAGAFPSTRPFLASPVIEALRGAIDADGFGPVTRLGFRRCFSPQRVAGGDGPVFETYDPAFEAVGEKTWLSGFFQSARYLPPVAAVRRWLTPSPEIAAERDRLIASLPAPPEAMVAVHVRRGDYLIQRDLAGGGDQGWALPDAYYRQALAQSAPGRRLAVFSDDTDHARRIFAELDPWTPPPGGSAAAEMLAMSRFGALVTANSSLSWWAAWLGEPGRRIIAPLHHVGWRLGQWLPGGIEVEGWTYVEVPRG